MHSLPHALPDRLPNQPPNHPPRAASIGARALRAGATLACLGALLVGPARAADERALGDALSLALPAATLGLELWRGDGAGAGQFARSFVVTVAAADALSRVSGVQRPDGTNDRSFPSGHAARAFAAATYLHRRHGFGEAWPAYALAGWVGYTRVQAGRHRWADVAGAAGLAAASSWWLVEPYRRESGPLRAPTGIRVALQIPLN